jgi:ABC-type amino acid transport substrate-binding protein
VMEKGSALKPSVDKAIKALRANGTLTRLQKRWLPFTRVSTLT